MGSKDNLISSFSEQFVVWCDENNLSVDQGEALADEIGSELDFAAIDRERYVPSADTDEEEA